MTKTLVLGIGNEILGDDGVGVHAARELSGRIDSPNVSFREASVSGLELVDLMRGYERVYLIDAVKTRDGVPGTVYRLGCGDVPTMHTASPHDMDLGSALEVARRLSFGVPSDIRIYGIEAESLEEFREGLSPKVAAAVPGIVEDIKKEIEKG